MIITEDMEYKYSRMLYAIRAVKYSEFKKLR
jgi:hypothetical protein